jgi:uncharacterized protein (DUF433 family)
MNAIVAIDHIVEDEDGTAWIKDTNVKVIEVVLDRLAYGWSPEEIHFQHPHLSMAQVHAALAYYYDHQSQLDGEINRRTREVEQMRQQTPPPLLVHRLQIAGGRKNLAGILNGTRHDSLSEDHCVLPGDAEAS